MTFASYVPIQVASIALSVFTFTPVRAAFSASALAALPLCVTVEPWPPCLATLDDA